LALVVVAVPCFAAATAFGPGRPLGEHGFERELRRNPDLRSFVTLRGYPDWVEEVEVDSTLPLDSYELRLYYLRLDREVAFTRAFILGRAGENAAVRPAVNSASSAHRKHSPQTPPAAPSLLLIVRWRPRNTRARRGFRRASRRSGRQFGAQMEHDFHQRLRNSSLCLTPRSQPRAGSGADNTTRTAHITMIGSAARASLA
jgi:hypothetical protein